MAQTPAVEGAAVSQARSLNKKPRREISGALHMLCQHKEKTKTGCAELRAKLCRIARRVSGSIGTLAALGFTEEKLDEMRQEEDESL